MYKSIVKPTMLYKMETVAVTERQVKKMEVAEIKMLRWVLGVTRRDKVRNRHIRGTAKMAKLGDKMRGLRLRWFGHMRWRGKGYVRR